MRPGLVALLACLLVRPGDAQSRGSIGLGAQTVRFPGGTAFSAAVLSPLAELNSPTTAASINGAIASLPQGVVLTQGRGDWWTETNVLTTGPRLAVEGTLAGTSSTNGASSAAAYGVGELLWARPVWGVAVGAGPSAGWISAEPSVLALHIRARGWRTWRAVSLTWTVEPTSFLGEWFTDVTTSLTGSEGPFVATVWASTRLSSFYGSSGAASGLLQYFVSPQVSLEFGGGSFLRDPYQGFPQGGYVTLGLRLHSDTRPLPSAPPVAPLLLSATDEHVQFRFARAKSVAIAGDWNGWQPMPLTPRDGDWEGALSLRAGLYHFDLVVDGQWVVPHGVATLADGFGGLVGLLVIQ
jgi:hypothetical protein